MTKFFFINIFLSISSFIFVFLGLFYIKKDLLKSNIYFIIANILTIIYAEINNLYFLLIQMFVYTFINIETLSKLSKNFKKFYINHAMYFLLLLFSIILFFNSNNDIYIKLDYIELLGALFGIIGSFTINIFRKRIIGLFFYIISEIFFIKLFMFIQTNYIYALMYSIFILINLHSVYYLILKNNKNINIKIKN